MRIDESEPSSSNSGTDMPPASATLLRTIVATKTEQEFVDAINRGREVHAVMGKTELYKWTEVLNRCDVILEKGTTKNVHGDMLCDFDAELKANVVSVIRFTVLLFECTSSRRIYKSIDRILLLLECTDMDTLAEVLRLLQVMGKRSKFLSQRIPGKDQHMLAHHLTAIAQCWGGKLRPVKMAECLKREPKLPTFFPFQYTDSKQRVVTVEQPKFKEGETVGELIQRTIPQLAQAVSTNDTTVLPFTREDNFCLLSRLRMLMKFDDWNHRFKCIIVRLLAVSTLVYCRLGGTEENTISSLLYVGFVEEIVDLLKADREADSQKDQMLHDGIQTEALSTLCSIVTYEKEPKITQILEALSAGSYHGFLSVMTRQIVEELKNNNLGKPLKPSVGLATALFSFIYHLASIEPGGDTLVGSGLTQTLLSVISFHELPIECITFGTRCARIIDLFTTIDVTAFKANNGMEICVNRVVHEINECRKDQPFVIDTSYDIPFEDEPEPEPEEDDEDGDGDDVNEPQRRLDDQPAAADAPAEADVADALADHQHLHAQPPREEFVPPIPPTSSPVGMDPKIKGGPWEQVQHNGTSCHQQRSGLIKGLLTFIKRAIGDVQFQDVMKHLMEGDLPEALMHILSNAEYYSPSLFHQSAHLITNFVYQFPEELSSLQRRHVPYVIFQSLLRKELPNSKDVITTLGNVFTAMCLNARGKRQFKSYDPFDQIFRIVLSVKFLVTLRKKRSADMFESATAIGGAMDDLMRHNPDLKHDMLKSIIVILDLLDELGRSPPEGVELVPTLTKAMARSVVFSCNTQSLLPAEASGSAPTAGTSNVPAAPAQQPATGRVAPPEHADERVGADAANADDEEPMEVEDAEDSDVDEEDNEMSMDEMSGEAVPAAPSPKPLKPLEYGAGMMCEDGSGKKILPIGDYMLLIARVVETMMTQSPSQKITDEFIAARGMQKIMRLCHLPCITNETTHSAYIASIANIIKHILKAGFQAQRSGPDAGPKLMAAIINEFIKTIEPLLEPKTEAAGDFSALHSQDIKKATLLFSPTRSEKLVEKTLMELNSIVPIMLNLNKSPMNSGYNTTDTRHRIFETWKMPEGIRLYSMLRKMSRMLCWEHELIQTLKPTIRTAATQTEGEMLSDQPVDTHLDVEVLPPWDDDEALEQDQNPNASAETIKEARWMSAGVTHQEQEFWTKNKPLQEIVTKSHHLVKELLNIMHKSINVANQRRPRARDAPPMTLVATQCISMIFSSIYKDLKWEPPFGNTSPMAYGRYIELLTQLNHALFEATGRCQNSALVQNFYTSGCHKAFFDLLSEKIIPFLGDDMPEGVERTMEEWCRLAAKLTERTALINSDIANRRDVRLPDFDTTKYLKLVCRDMFTVYKQFFEKMAQMPDWELKSLKKVCENAFSVFKEVAKNLVEETEDAASGDTPPDEWAPGLPRVVQVPGGAGGAAAGLLGLIQGGGANNEREAQLQTLMEMGFSREIAQYALDTTRNADEAANYLLIHGHEHEAAQAEINAAFPGAVDPVVRHAPVVNAEPSVQLVEAQLRRQLVNLEGELLIQNASRVLREQRVERFDEEIADLFPEGSRGSLTVDGVITEIINRMVNPRNQYEENIATPLIPPLSQLKIEQEVSLNSACKQLFPLVKRLLLVSNDTIHPCAELILSIFPAMSEEWRKDHLIAEIIGDDLLQMTQGLVRKEYRNEVARHMANRLHFTVLIFDKVSDEYINWIDDHGVIPEMLKALEFLVERFKTVDYYQSLITRIICWFDLYAKSHRLIVRRKYLESLSKSLEWSFQTVEDDQGRRRGDYTPVDRKWFPYDATAQKIINDAFFSGARSCKCVVKRGNRPSKKVDIDFGSMKQSDGAGASARENVKAELPITIEVKIQDLMRSEATLNWSEEHNDLLMRLAVEVLQVGALDPKCSHSVLSFLSRQTKAARNAKTFMELQGMPAMLRLKARCAPSYPFLVSVIIRNCIDDDALLGQVYEKTIRQLVSVPNNTPVSVAEYGHRKSKDFADTLNLLAPLSSRNPLVFTEAFNKLARLQGTEVLPMIKKVSPTAGFAELEAASMGIPSTSGPHGSTSSSSTALVLDSNHRAIEVVQMMMTEVFHGDFPTTGQTRMLSQEKIITILAEIIKSYPSLAVIITETQHDGQSAIFSLIDSCLTTNTTIPEKVDKTETTSSLKTLIAVIAAAHSASKAQDMLIVDIKSTLSNYAEKALELRREAIIVQNHPDSDPVEREMAFDELHKDEKDLLTKISEICGIIVTMCQSCTAHHHHHHSDRHRGEQARPQNQQNSVMKMFNKKKMCAELVKMIHCLQLNTKDSLDTVNQILKTLDTLLEGSSAPPTTSASSASRAFMEMVSGRHPRTRREIILERDLDALMADERDHEFNEFPEMRNLFRHFNEPPFRVGRGAVGAVGIAVEEDESEASDRERSDSPSEASEHAELAAQMGELRDDAAGDEDVNMIEADQPPAQDRPRSTTPPRAAAEDVEMAEAQEEQERVEAGEEEADEDDDGAVEDDHPRNDEDDDDDDDEDVEDEDDDDDDEDEVRVEQNPEPAVVNRRIMVDEDGDEDDDDDNDEDGDSMEDDARALEMDDDYFDLGGPFDAHRMDDIIFPPSFGRGAGVSAFADMFRDDFDFLPTYRTERRPLGRSVGLGGVLNDHPLMVRPPADNDVTRRPTAAYRAELMMHGPRTSLSRQNAIRRTTEIRELEAISRSIRMGEIPPARMLVRGTGESIHSSFLDHIFDLRPTSQLHRLTSYSRNYMTGDRDDRRDVRASQVPSCLDRLESFTQSMEPVSIRFVTIIVNSYLTSFHKTREGQIRREADSKARVKKELEALKRANAEKREAAAAAEAARNAPEAAPEELGLATPAATNTTNTVSETQAPNAAAVRGEETATTPAGNAPGSSDAQAAAPEVDQEPQEDAEEPMETGDDDAPQPQSSAATAASSVAGGDLEEDMLAVAAEVPVAEEGGEQAEAPEDQNAPAPAAVVAEEPARVVQEMPEEFRAILGDIEIPEGVDPAFLAALPEDMRAEVIRDYQRQQRADRAARPNAAAPAQEAAAAAPAAEGAAAPGGAPAAADAPLVEPIDPVFLNALPPELQEEVLAEHERRVREAEEQLRRQNAPPAPVVEMDAAAVIGSLPLNERAQVLAEMDETELANLPVDMQNEARRARQQAEPNMMRYQRFLFRGAGGAAAPAGVQVQLHRTGTRAGRPPSQPTGPGNPDVGNHAGQANQAPNDFPHLLDRESIQTLCLLYLVDNNRVPHTRLQKVLRSACVNQTTCDFIVWCLLALLDKASEANSDDEDMVSNVPAWLDSIAVSGVGQHEKVLRISENAQKVSIHSMLAVPMCKNILDLLASIARAYPGNFLPAVLRREAKPTDISRQAPSFHTFWTMVQTSSPKVPRFKDWTAAPAQQLEECPLGQMLNSLKKPTMAKSPLKEKVLKVASQIIQTLPTNTCELIGIKDQKDQKPLRQKLENVIRVMTTGSCSAEGLSDGLTILSEAMRTFSDDTAVEIYQNLFAAVSKLGSELLPQIDHLIVELDEAQKTDEGPSDGPSTSTSQPKKSAQVVVDTSAAGRSAIGRFDGERLVIDGDQNMRLQMSSCKELQLPAVTVLTDKGGAQYALLSALQTLVKVRNHMKFIRREKKKKIIEARDRAEKALLIEADIKKNEAAKLRALEDPVAAAAEEAAANAAHQHPDAVAARAKERAKEEARYNQELDEDKEPRISERLADLESLWNSLSECLLRLGKASDPHAVLALQPAAEAFFLVHAANPIKARAMKEAAEAKRKESQTAGSSSGPSTSAPSTSAAAVASSLSHDGLLDFDQDTIRLVEFAEKHRQVLNQALRQNNAVLAIGGPFAVLTQFPKLLDFDVKRKFFRKELTKMEPAVPRYRRNDVTVQVSRNRVFSESFRELFRLAPAQWKNRFYVIFQGEEAQDAGGVLREWFSVITREIFNPNYALFTTAPGDMVTYMINKASYINPEHLDYFKFVGRLIAKSVFEHKYLDCYFTRAFYKHILNLPVRYQDLESEDPAFFKSLEFLLVNSIDDMDLDLTFSTEVEEFGVRSVRDLKPNGRKIEVNDANKDEYVKLVCQTKMTGSIRKQLDAFLSGFYEIIPKDLISMFNEQELELLISGLPDVDIDDLAANTDYKGFQKTSTHIQWFWRALRSFEKEDKAKFLQFVTGTSKVPLQGFASLEGMNGVQKFSIHMDSRGGDRLPAAHTCFNQLDLPQYDSYDKMRHSLLLAIRECTEGFGFA